MLRSCESTNVKGDAVNPQQELQLVQPCQGWVLQCPDAQGGQPSIWDLWHSCLSHANHGSLQSKASRALMQATEVTTM